MSETTTMRDQTAVFATSIYDRRLTSGSTGNISARLSDGTILMTPTGSSMGFIDPARIEVLVLSGIFRTVRCRCWSGAELGYLRKKVVRQF